MLNHKSSTLITTGTYTESKSQHSTGLKLWGNIQYSLPRNHTPTCQHTKWKERTWELLKKTTSVLLKNWHTAPSGGSKQVLFLPLCTTQMLHNDTGNQSAFHPSHFSKHQASGSRERPPGYGLFGRYGEYESYLGIVLEHLIALHVVTLEHDDRSVEAGDVQTEVVCPNFFICCVREHLGKKRCLSQKMKHRHYHWAF